VNQEVQKDWLEELRSGKYAKGKHHLKNIDGKFCCLGILCEIWKNKVQPEKQWQPGLTALGQAYKMINSYSIPAKPILDWAGIDTNIACFLGKLNDDTETFEEVIAEIEKL